jgi:hypothetical protein
MLTLISIMWSFTPSYKRVPELDSRINSSFDEKQDFSPQNSSNIKYFLVLLVLANTLALGLLIPFLRLQHVPRSSPPNHYPTTCPSPSASTSSPGQEQDCGTTIASARAANCSFDLLSNSWMPTSCYDSETDLEFRSWIARPNRTHGAWPYFTSSSLSPSTHIPDIETLSSMTGLWLWTTEEEHIAHCIFWARRIHRALEGSFRWSKGVENMQHTFHCAYEVLDNLLVEAPLKKAEKGVVHFKVQFDTCA